MIDKDSEISIRKQLDLLNLSKSSFYYKKIISLDGEIANAISEIYEDSDCRYGYRKITKLLNKIGYKVNHKKVLKIMRSIGIQGLYPSKRGNYIKHPNKVYPYLLADLSLNKPDIAWSTDITYIDTPDGFVYFLAIIDIYSRYIISYDLSATMDSSFCVSCLDESLKKGKPLIFNTDQGSQFTSNDFTSLLLANNIQISMANKGRCFDNIHIERLWRTLKQEAIYYYKPDTLSDLESCIIDFVDWYNNFRLHQSLDYKTPSEFYKSKKGGF